MDVTMISMRKLPDGPIQKYGKPVTLRLRVPTLSLKKIAEIAEEVKEEERQRKATARKRFTEPVIVNTNNLTPRQEERLKLQYEAFRSAIYIDDLSFGRKIGFSAGSQRTEKRR